MSAVAHKAQVRVPVQRAEPIRRAHRVPARRPPTRRHPAGAPRVLTRAACATRRARLSVAWVLVVASVSCAAVVGLGALSDAMAPAVPSSTTVVRVKPGESLWELAGRVAPGVDASAVVARIKELNGVEGAVQPGQPLTVPVER